MDKVSSWECCNKKIELTFKTFRMEIFHIYNFKSKGRTRSILIALFIFGFKKKKIYQVSKRFFYKTQVFVNWFA